MKSGYTLIELLVVCLIIVVFTTFGLSSYSASRNRQIASSATNQIITILKQAQKEASIGDSNCTSGKFNGISIKMFDTGSAVKTQKLCTPTPNEPLISTPINGIRFNGSVQFTIRPLSNGFNLAGATSLPINFTSGSLTYQIVVEDSGNIVNKGVQQ